MYAYFIHAHDQSRHEKKLTQIRSNLKKRRIAAEFYIYHSQEELQHFVDKNTTLGVKTFISIGDKATFYSVINCFDIHTQEPMTFGHIPLSNSHDISEFLGIKSEQDAVEVISQRKIASITPILCGNMLILDDITLKNSSVDEQCTLVIDRSLRLTFPAHEIRITNKQSDQHSSQPFELAAFRNSHQVSMSSESAIQLPEKLKTRLSHPLFQADQVLHLSATRAQIVLPAPYETDVLSRKLSKLMVTASSKPIAIITKKHIELK